MMENNGQSMAEIMKDLYRKSYREAAKVIVAGGRDFTDYEFMKESLGHLFAQEDFCGDSDIKIISGMADGADTLAIRFADEFELTKILFPANWKLHHRMAGFLRNEDMMEIATIWWLSGMVSPKELSILLSWLRTRAFLIGFLSIIKNNNITMDGAKKLTGLELDNYQYPLADVSHLSEEEKKELFKRGMCIPK